jgi:F420-dependent oxidoreductase-like protein
MQICVFVEPQDGASWPELLAFAQASERLGFHGFFRSDHYLTPDGVLRGTPSVSDAWTTLAGLAAATSRIRLGTLVSSVTYRQPGVLAVQVANVDAMSEGRVELGLGTGWNAREHTAYGIPFPERRFGMLEEQLEIVTGLWRTPVGGSFSFAGKHYALANAPGHQRPFDEGIPVIVGGSGAVRTPALAARYASEFNAGFAPTATLSERYGRAVAAAEAIDRDPATLRLSAALTTTVGSTEAEADARAASLGLDGEQTRVSGIHGTPQAVLDRVGALADAGVGRVYLQLLDIRDLDQLELLAAEVLPRL